MAVVDTDLKAALSAAFWADSGSPMDMIAQMPTGRAMAKNPSGIAYLRRFELMGFWSNRLSPRQGSRTAFASPMRMAQ